MQATGNLAPAPLYEVIVGMDSTINTSWKNWFAQLYNKIGGAGSSDFQPTLSADSSAGVVTYVTRSGRYTRLGTIRIIEFTIEISNWTGSPTGNVIIGGFPAAFAHDSSCGTIGLYNKITLNASHTQLSLVGSLGETFAYLYSSGSGSGISAAKIPVANVGTTAKIIGSITYSV